MEVEVKKWFWLLAAAALVLAVGCKGEEEMKQKAAEETKLEISEGYVSVEDGVQLRYKTIGNGAEAVIIPAAIYLEYEFEKLADPSRTLILYDPRGRGKSSEISDTSRISMDLEITDLEALRRHFGKDKVSLIGWSYLGGVVALYADRFPEHVNRVVQIGPIPPTFDLYKQAQSADRDMELMAQLNKLQQQGLAESDPERFCREFGKIYMKTIFFDPAKISLLHSDVCKCANEMPDKVMAQLAAVLGSIGEWDWRESLQDLDIPVLTIHGAADLLPEEGSRMWVKILRNARLLFVQEAGHLPFVEQPEVFYPAVDTFLKGQWPAGAEIFGAPIE